MVGGMQCRGVCMVILIKLFLSLSSQPVFEFKATAKTAMGSGFLVQSPNPVQAVNSVYP